MAIVSFSPQINAHSEVFHLIKALL